MAEEMDDDFRRLSASEIQHPLAATFVGFSKAGLIDLGTDLCGLLLGTDIKEEDIKKLGSLIHTLF